MRLPGEGLEIQLDARARHPEHVEDRLRGITILHREQQEKSVPSDSRKIFACCTIRPVDDPAVDLHAIRRTGTTETD